MIEPGAKALAAKLRRDAASLIQEAMRKQAQASGLEGGGDLFFDNHEIVDFDSLPGHAPRARAEALLVGRRIRDQIFPPGIFGEPAWDLLLGLFLAREGSRGVPLNAALAMTFVPPRTAQRWIDLLAERSLLEQIQPMQHEPTATVRLTANGLELMSRFFAFTEGQGSRSSPRDARRGRSAAGRDAI